MRVTNYIGFLTIDKKYRCFNPLYAGHKPVGNIMGKTISNVSIPYMRVTNEAQKIRKAQEKALFQSPICGSQTHNPLIIGRLWMCFNPLYAGHKRHKSLKTTSIYLCFNPLYAGHKPSSCYPAIIVYLSFNPLYAGHKLGACLQRRRANLCFNPLYAGHKRS